MKPYLVVAVPNVGMVLIHNNGRKLGGTSTQFFDGKKENKLMLYNSTVIKYDRNITEGGFMMKRKQSVLLLAVMSLMVTGCGSSKTDWEYIVEKNELVVGFTDFPPMGYLEEGVATGFDIELAEKVMEELGIPLRTRYISWDAKVMELDGKRIDAIWNGLTITPEREEQMTFSEPYFENNLIILSKTDNPLNDREDLAAMNVGVEVSSSADIALAKETALVETLESVKKYDNSAEAFLALSAGQIDAMIVDEVYARYVVLPANPGMYQIGEEILGSEYYGIGFRKGDDDLAARIDAVLDQLVVSGFVAELSQRYFGEDLFYRP